MMRRTIKLAVAAITMSASVVAACGDSTGAVSISRTSSTVPSQTTSRSDERGKTHHHLVHQPVVIVEPTSSGPAFQVRLRLDSAPPSDAQGAKLNVLVGRSGADAPPQRYGVPTRHCYELSIGNDTNGEDPSLKNARAGSKVRVSVRVSGQPTIVHSETLHSKRGARAALADLGCTRK
jgi:hypothetical protein